MDLQYLLGWESEVMEWEPLAMIPRPYDAVLEEEGVTAVLVAVVLMVAVVLLREAVENVRAFLGWEEDS